MPFRDLGGTNEVSSARERWLSSRVEELERITSNVSLATYSALLWQCGLCRSLAHGKRIHAHMSHSRRDLEHESFLSNLLVQMYSQCGSLPDAVRVFERLHHPDSNSWNTMMVSYVEHGELTLARDTFDRTPNRDAKSWNCIVAAYAQKGHMQEAVQLLGLMDLNGFYPDRFSFVKLLVACPRSGMFLLAKSLHSDISLCGLETDTVVGTAIVDTYGRFGRLKLAREAFSRIEMKNVVSFTAMLAAYARNGHLLEARELFHHMPSRTVVSWNAMLAGYIHNGDVAEASRIFNKMVVKNVISWTSLITGYVHNGHPNDALHLFRLMHRDGVQPNSVTFTSVVDACTSLGDLKQGRVVQLQVVEHGSETEVSVGNSLITMFGRCGLLTEARRCFRKIPGRNVISWTALIAANAENGENREALRVFNEMELEGVKPNEVTFTSVLTACSHAGLHRLGKEYFMSLVDSYGLKPCPDHYACMVDLLARCGRVSEAQELLETMPFEPGVVAWTSLASACSVKSSGGEGGEGHVCVSGGTSPLQVVKQNICMSEQTDSGPFMLLSNVFSGV